MTTSENMKSSRLGMKGIFKKHDGVSTRTIGDEVILVPAKGELALLQQVFVLNAVGAFIWDHLDGIEDLAHLRTEMTVAFEVASAQAEDDIRGYVEELVTHGLVVEINPDGP